MDGPSCRMEKSSRSFLFRNIQRHSSGWTSWDTFRSRFGGWNRPFCGGVTEPEMSTSKTVPEVALVWQRARTTHDAKTRPCIKVSLQPIEIEETILDTSCVVTGTNDPSSAPVENAIPDSVLRYERQLRKAQHAKKVGRELPKKDDLSVIYVDESLVVVNKPAGVLTVPGLNAHPSLLDRVHELYGQKIEDPVHMIVHRLDMDTSGLVIFARSLEVSKQLHSLFRERQVVKEYECLAMGHLQLPEWEDDSSRVNTLWIDLPLQRDHEHPPFMRVSTPHSEAAAMSCVDQLQKHGWKKIMRKPAKPSQSLVTIVEVGSTEGTTTKQALPYTRLRLEPITGRTHQLRVHCAAIGFPIVGDPTYSLYGEAAMFGGLDHLKSYQYDTETALGQENEIGRQEGNARCSIDTMKAWTIEYPPNDKPMCLHAAFLELHHPVTGNLCRWHAPPDF